MVATLETTRGARQAGGRVARPGGRVGTILRLAAPLTAFFGIQTATSLATLAMIGHLGDAALAGLGGGGAVYGVALALLFGIDAAVQPIVSRAAGAGNDQKMARALVDGQAVAIPLAIFLALGLLTAGPAILAAMLPSAAAARAGAAYVSAAAPSLVFMAFTIPINSVWIGSGRPARAFLVTTVLAPVQIGATLVLVFGLGPLAPMGAAGVGAALSIVSLIGVGLQIGLAMRGIPGFFRARPGFGGAGSIAGLGWPISLQQALLQFGLMIAFVIVGRLGVESAAAANVLISLATVPIQLAVGFGVAASTLVGQSLGRGDVAEARRWGWRTTGLGIALTAPLGLIAVFAPRHLLDIFLHDPATLALAVWPARLVGLGVAADAATRILCFAIRGAGATRIGAAIPFAAQWLFRLPLGAWAALALGMGLLGFAAAETGVTVVEAGVTAMIWAGARWTRQMAVVERA
jgi:putative MATE family efflux protein